MNTRLLLASALGSLTLSGSAWAITVDGNLDDWGVNHSTWIPSAGIHRTIEDQTGSGSYRLTPGWGGQAYDAEALYATITGGKLYIALATGHNPRTLHDPARNSYGAGDFAIDFGKDGSYEIGININHALTRSGDNYTFENDFKEGGVYKNASWNLGLWNTSGDHDPGNPDPGHPTSLKGGTWVGDASLVYTTTGVTGFGASPTTDLHYFYEISVDLSLLTAAGWDGNPFNIHWTENCANDSIMVDPPGSVPEPGTLALLGIGLLSLTSMRRRRCSRLSEPSSQAAK